MGNVCKDIKKSYEAVQQSVRVLKQEMETVGGDQTATRLRQQLRQTQNVVEKLTSQIEQAEFHRAESILKEAAVGLETAEKVFGKLTKKERAALRIIPFSSELLEKHKLTHVLVADLGRNLMQMQIEKSFFMQDEEFWFETDEPGWKLIERYPNYALVNYTFQDQMSFVESDEEIPSARQLVSAELMFREKSKSHFLTLLLLRTVNTTSDDRRVAVAISALDENKIVIQKRSDGLRDPAVGLCTMIKSNQ